MAKAETRTQRLERELKQAQARIRVLESKDIRTYAEAAKGVRAAGETRLKGSGAILTITHLSGAVIVPPVTIEDGLSRDSIEALVKDIRRSSESRIAFYANIA